MAYNPDINNSVNLRRNIMRVMNEAERNVRTWSNYVIEDRANLTKSSDCRAKTANTSKTKMFSAIVIINNLEEQFKADNKLIRRLTNNGIFDDKYFLREMAKNDVQEHLLEDTIRETRRYAEATIAEMISIEREILQGRVSNHLEFVERDALQESVRMMAREMNQMKEAFLTGAGASIDDRRDDDERSVPRSRQSTNSAKSRRSRVDTSPDDQSSRRSTSTRRSRSPSTQRSATPQKSSSTRRSSSSEHSSENSSPEKRRPTPPPSPKRPRSRQPTPGSPEPKRRNPSPLENNRVIYPMDYVTRKARNDCAFCGRNHYSDNCGKVVDPMDREVALQRIGRCRKCLTLPQYNCGPKCGREVCRYCHIGTDHHYSLCPTPRVVFRRPADYATRRRSPSPDYFLYHCSFLTPSLSLYFTPSNDLSLHPTLSPHDAFVPRLLTPPPTI